MADIKIFLSDKIKLDWEEKQLIRWYLQAQVNRYIQGHCRYGRPKADKKFFSRLKEEVKAYNRTGNVEHILNNAVYGLLECIAPEHPKHHFNNNVDSVTRGKEKFL